MSKFPFLLSLLTLSLASGTALAQKPKILYLGDSQSMGAFGRTVDARLRETGAELFTVVAAGSSPYYWLKAYQSLPCTSGYWEKFPTSERRVAYVRAVPKLEDLLAEHSPQIVVVQTGINLYATLRSRRQPKEANVREIQSQIDQMCQSIAKSGAAPYWIFPPHSHEKRYSLELQEELTGIMRSTVAKHNGTVFESREVTRFTDPYPETDGIHYGPAEAAAWGEKVAKHLAAFVEARKQEKPARKPEELSESTRVPKIEGGMMVAAAAPAPLPSALQTAEQNPQTGSSPEAAKTFPVLDLELRLLEKSEIKDISQIDYANALGIYEYEVIEDRLGNYPHKKIRVAHGIVFRKKYTSAASREIGSRTSMRLVPLEAYKALSGWQMKDDLRPNFEMPIYTPKLD